MIGAVKATAHYNGWREKQMRWVTRKRVRVNRAATAWEVRYRISSAVLAFVEWARGASG